MEAAKVKLSTSSGAAHPSEWGKAPVWTANSEMARNDTRKARAAMAPTRALTMARRRGSVMAAAPAPPPALDLEAGAAAATGPWSSVVRPGRHDGAGGAWASGLRPRPAAQPPRGRG